MKLADEKIMDRIRKLLAMAKDSASPNEAAIAASRARKLMDQYQVDEMDLTTVDTNEFGHDDLQTGFKYSNTAMGFLALAVGKMNDCIVTYERDFRTSHLNLRFKGFLVDAVCSIEMMKYLREEMYRYAKQVDGRGERNAYRLGFASGVSDQVRSIMRERNKIETQTGTALVVVKNQLVTEHFGNQEYSRRGYRMSGSDYAYQAGKEQGRATNLDRQMSQDKNRISATRKQLN